MLEYLIDNNNTFFYLLNSNNYIKYPQKWNKNRNISFVVFCNVDKLEGVLESFFIR